MKTSTILGSSLLLLSTSAFAAPEMRGEDLMVRAGKAAQCKLTTSIKAPTSKVPAPPKKAQEFKGADAIEKAMKKEALALAKKQGTDKPKDCPEKANAKSPMIKKLDAIEKAAQKQSGKDTGKRAPSEGELSERANGINRERFTWGLCVPGEPSGHGDGQKCFYRDERGMDVELGCFQGYYYTNGQMHTPPSLCPDDERYSGCIPLEHKGWADCGYYVEGNNIYLEYKA